jgi:NADPH-dependent 2,4-dienoyl-CoA reductase/sulfur reductase-like enzyme
LRREGFDGTVRIVSAEERLPVDRPPLSKQILAGTWEPDKAALRGVDEADAEWILGRRAVALDVASHAVTLDDGSVVDGDAVLIATGATPRRLPAAVADPALDGLHELRTVDDCLRLRGALGHAGRVVIIGAGFIGSEVASTSRGLGVDVTLLEMLPIPLERVLGAEIGTMCARLHKDNGVDLRLGSAVAGVDADARGHVARVRLADGSAVEADTVVVGVGVAPEVTWLADSGLELRDGVVCDARCEAAPGVAAAGDVARWFHEGYGHDVRVEHWTNASEQGAAAAVTLLRGAEAPAYRPVPYFWSDQYGSKIQFLGHCRPGDEVHVEEGSADEGRFVASYRREGRLTAVVLWNRPSRLAHWMGELAS